MCNFDTSNLKLFYAYTFSFCLFISYQIHNHRCRRHHPIIHLYPRRCLLFSFFHSVNDTFQIHGIEINGLHHLHHLVLGVEILQAVHLNNLVQMQVEVVLITNFLSLFYSIIQMLSLNKEEMLVLIIHSHLQKRFQTCQLRTGFCYLNLIHIIFRSLMFISKRVAVL